MKMTVEHLCLKWNNFENNIASYLDILRNENDFVDVTITCGEKNFKAHKVILSACSPYFRGIFQENPCSHPVIILKNVTSNEMEAIIQYIYTGETYIAKDDLFSFLNTANLLQIIGLINYNLYDGEQPVQNGTYGHKGNDLVNHSKTRITNNHNSQQHQQQQQQQHNHHSSSSNNNNNHQNNSHSTGGSGNTTKSTVLVKKFASVKADEPLKKSAQSSEVVQAKKRQNPRPHSDGEQSPGENATPKGTEDNCPILSKQLLLPKKRKLSTVDQNKNEFYDHSELSNSSEEVRENGTILRTCLEDREKDADTETDDEGQSFQNGVTIKKEAEESDNVLEPEVGLCVKEESEEFETGSEESLHNGDILLQRLQAFQDSKGEGSSDQAEDILLKVPKPDVSIFSKKLARGEGGECENLTLTPNVEIFLRNANNSSDNLINKLTRINLFKPKQFKKLKKPILLKSDVIAGPSKCGGGGGTGGTGGGGDGKDSIGGGTGGHPGVKNGLSADSKTFHLTNLPCPHCRQEYNNLSALKYHVRLMHSDLENKLFCHLCPMNFIEREYFKIHLWEAHNARF